jgi:hypothetical protein
VPADYGIGCARIAREGSHVVWRLLTTHHRVWDCQVLAYGPMAKPPLGRQIGPLERFSSRPVSQPITSRRALQALKCAKRSHVLWQNRHMPTRPPLHRPPGSDASRRARAERDRQRQALRPGPVERGYDGEWQRARKHHLANHPACSVFGCTMPATDVDHIQSVQDRPDLRLEPSNFRSMCHPHHAQRTARDQGFARTGEGNSVNAPLRGARHPEWLRPSIVPLTLVCGAPGAGKSTYVEQRRGPKDMVLDLDAIIAKLSGQPLYQAAPSWRDAALRWRNGRLSLIGYVSSRWPMAWLIVAEPRDHWRQWWVDKMRARVVVLETPLATCVERVTVDDRRSVAVRQRHCEGIGWWWSAYTRRNDDLIIRPDVRATTGRALLQQAQGSPVVRSFDDR